MASCQIEQRLPASFKGVGFYCLKGGSEHGRRGAEGEFPFGEETAYADLGRKIRVFTLTARFAGPTYIEDTAALIAACESPGPGDLVHPTRGLINAACRKCETSEDYDQGDGVSEVELEFVEAQAGSMSLTAMAGVSIDSSVGAILDFLSASWDMSAVPFYAVGAVTTTASDALVSAARALNAASTQSPESRSSENPAPDQSVLTALSNVSLATDDGESIQDGATLASLLGATLSTLDAKALSPVAQFSALVGLANWASRNSKQPTEAARSAEDALFASIRALCAAYMARAVQGMGKGTGKTTMDAALRRIDQIETLLHEEEAGAIAACNNGLHLTLRKLEQGTVPPLYALAYQSPPIVIYNLLGGVPSLVVAHQIYGDARKFAQVEAMNPYAWPWAVGPRVHALRQ